MVRNTAGFPPSTSPTSIVDEPLDGGPGRGAHQAGGEELADHEVEHALLSPDSGSGTGLPVGTIAKWSLTLVESRILFEVEGPSAATFSAMPACSAQSPLGRPWSSGEQLIDDGP